MRSASPITSITASPRSCRRSRGWINSAFLIRAQAPTLQKAREPAVLEWQGRRIGMLQRTSVFWTTDHEAADNAVGVATIRGHTAYQVPMFRAGPGAIPLNRPGVPPAIVTWADTVIAALSRRRRGAQGEERYRHRLLSLGCGSDRLPVHAGNRPYCDRRRR